MGNIISGTKERTAIPIRALKKTDVAQDVEQPQIVEQPHTVEQPQFVEQPKDVEQAQDVEQNARCGTMERSAILVCAKK